jgi:AcrR family transcriptional regulator
MVAVKDAQHSKQQILAAAFRVIHQKGFNRASVKEILADTGLTKGAFYHHFASKEAMGKAILDEIEGAIGSVWLEPIEALDDPITGIQEAMRAYAGSLSAEEVALGCPLNKLALELAPTDDFFRVRIKQIYDGWRSALADALRRGQRAGTVSQMIDPMGAATFFVAAQTGGRGLAKNAHNADILSVCADHLVRYLDTLRP